ncbi:trace amine-associated receptor 1b [Chanos chanos]|uniref:Trace amine-associated receptor 1b n=1 Tax=Chanos chanos TaxID=29144 RepID=A0A6J2W0C7_CHACN|nr:trace amine-associated receptor 1-like [Chanos chanos]
MNLSNSSKHNTAEFTDTLFCFESLSGSCKKLSQPFSVQTIVFVTGTIIGITVIGNFLVIISIAHFRQLHTPTNYLILSLTTCDLLLGLFVMPLSAAKSAQGCWYMGEFLCKFHTSADITLSTASIFHLTFISAERYCAVYHPLTYHLLIRHISVLLMVTISWLLPTLFGYGVIFTGLNFKGSEDFYYTHIQCIGGCAVFFSGELAVFASFTSFFIPGSIMLWIYSRIYVVVRGQVRSIEHLANQLSRSRQQGSPTSGHCDRKGTATIAIVFGGFLICWAPFFLCLIINPFIEYSINPVLIDVLMWFGYFNSTINPFIYAIRYTWFRAALKIILSGKVFHENTSRIQLSSYE